MLSRKNFVAVASSAFAEITSLTGIASAQSPAPASGLTRKILSRMDGPAVGYETLLVDVGVDAGAVIPRHTHPGIESTYILEGHFELPIEGQPTRVLKPGDGFQIPAGVAHGGGPASSEKLHILVTYVVEKDKPLAKPA